jgi:hypothetical protein
MDWQTFMRLREPYKTELDYFKSNPHVAGMAAEDDYIILNPFSKLSEEQKQSVIKNEAARIFMRNSRNRPNFFLTPEQTKIFNGYGSPQDIRETIAARIFSNDPSYGQATKEQLDYVKKYFGVNQ